MYLIIDRSGKTIGGTYESFTKAQAEAQAEGGRSVYNEDLGQIVYTFTADSTAFPEFQIGTFKLDDPTVSGDQGIAVPANIVPPPTTPTTPITTGAPGGAPTGTTAGPPPSQTLPDGSILTYNPNTSQWDLTPAPVTPGGAPLGTPAGPVTAPVTGAVTAPVTTGLLSNGPGAAGPGATENLTNEQFLAGIDTSTITPGTTTSHNGQQFQWNGLTWTGLVATDVGSPGGAPLGTPAGDGTKPKTTAIITPGTGALSDTSDEAFLRGVTTSALPAGSTIYAPTGIQYRYDGTTWTAIAGTGQAAAPTPAVNPFVDESFLFGQPTFAEAVRGQGIPNFQGLGGAFLQRQYEPALASFLGQQAVNAPQIEIDPTTGQPMNFEPNPFRNFVSANLGGSGFNRSALGSFQDLLGASRAGGTPNSLGLGSAFANPANERQAQLAANLGLGALRGSIGSLAASQLAPNASQLFNQFAMSGQAANQNAFLPFLNERLGLGF